eukprot:2589613-Alexandrium_andersonii.AAC.1
MPRQSRRCRGPPGAAEAGGRPPPRRAAERESEREKERERAALANPDLGVERLLLPATNELLVAQ